jgi:hypothetical protein
VEGVGRGEERIERETGGLLEEGGKILMAEK